MRLALLGILAPFAANSAGWIFTEMGRQPFAVAPNPNPSGVDGVFMFTASAVSPTTTAGELLFSLISLTLVYAALLVVEVILLVKFVRAGIAGVMPVSAGSSTGDSPTAGDGPTTGGGSTTTWVTFWTWAIGLGSFVSAFGVGAALALTTTGLPLDANGDRVGGPFAWLTPYAVLGGLAVIGFCLVHAAAFLALKTDGPVRVRARAFLVAVGPFALLPIVAWVIAVQLTSGSPLTWAIVLVAVVAVVFGWINARRGREGLAFVGVAAFLVAGAASIFAAVYPVVLPSTIDHAFDLTISNASSGDYTLGVMSVVTAFGLPVVLLYQGYTYWVFRKRLAEHHLPEVQRVEAAVAR
jgi:hypothetical protein